MKTFLLWLVCLVSSFVAANPSGGSSSKATLTALASSQGIQCPNCAPPCVTNGWTFGGSTYPTYCNTTAPCSSGFALGGRYRLRILRTNRVITNCNSTPFTLS